MQEKKIYKKNSLVLNSILTMLNPVFYIKVSAFVDEVALMEKCHQLSFQDFFEMPKNCLVVAGDLSLEDLSKIEKIHHELLPPRLVISLGEASENLKEKIETIRPLSKNFTREEFLFLAEEMIRGQDV